MHDQELDQIDESDLAPAVLNSPSDWEEMWKEANHRLRHMFPTRQITDIYSSGAYSLDIDLTGVGTSSGLLTMTEMPREVARCIPKQILPCVRPVITSVGLKPLTGTLSYSIVADLIGRIVNKGTTPPMRGVIPLFNETAAFFSAFNVPVPVDTEAGYHPYNLRLVTSGKNGRAIATVNYQWDLVSYHAGMPGSFV